LRLASLKSVNSLGIALCKRQQAKNPGQTVRRMATILVIYETAQANNLHACMLAGDQGECADETHEHDDILFANQ
jgi:hypothetical protein